MKYLHIKLIFPLFKHPAEFVYFHFYIFIPFTHFLTLTFNDLFVFVSMSIFFLYSIYLLHRLVLLFTLNCRYYLSLLMSCCCRIYFFLQTFFFISWFMPAFFHPVTYLSCVYTIIYFINTHNLMHLIIKKKNRCAVTSSYHGTAPGWLYYLSTLFLIHK